MLTEWGFSPEQAQRTVRAVEPLINSLDAYDLVRTASTHMNDEHEHLYTMYDQISANLAKNPHGYLYTLNGAKTYLAMRFLLEELNISLPITTGNIGKYSANTIVQIKQNYHDMGFTHVNSKAAAFDYYNLGKCPFQLIDWIIMDFAENNFDLQHLLLPQPSLSSDEGLDYIWRGIGDVAGPFHNAFVRNKILGTIAAKKNYFIPQPMKT